MLNISHSSGTKEKDNVFLTNLFNNFIEEMKNLLNSFKNDLKFKHSIFIEDNPIFLNIFKKMINFQDNLISFNSKKNSNIYENYSEYDNYSMIDVSEHRNLINDYKNSIENLKKQNKAIKHVFLNKFNKENSSGNNNYDLMNKIFSSDLEKKYQNNFLKNNQENEYFEINNYNKEILNFLKEEEKKIKEIAIIKKEKKFEKVDKSQINSANLKKHMLKKEIFDIDQDISKIANELKIEMINK